jgi:chlorobactene glucosyltransferase
VDAPLRPLLWGYALGNAAFYLFLHLLAHPFRHTARRYQQSFPVPQEGLAEEVPSISIIVPARNEEANIGRCVRSLLRQDYERYEVIVVDDGSSDRTGLVLEEIAAEPGAQQRLRILALPDELPPGWAGKPHALDAGAALASGDWLVFTDADSYWSPATLRITLQEALAGAADLLSLIPEQVLPDFWNRVAMPLACMGMSLQFPPLLVNHPRLPLATANGQYILLRRALYEQIGGYARPELRGSPLDDRDLAAVVKRLGYRIRLIDGRGLVHVRMYRDLPALWRGWRKTIFVGSGGLHFMLAALLGLPLVTILPFLLPLLLWLGRRRLRRAGLGGRTLSLVSTTALLPLLGYRLSLNKGLALPWYHALLHPLGGLLFMGILGQACWRKLTGRGVEWRGRLYGARPRASRWPALIASPEDAARTPPPATAPGAVRKSPPGSGHESPAFERSPKDNS